MIYTITFNPAIDYVMQIDDLQIGEINRASEEQIFFGGKGINVSIVLKALGVESQALGFISGFTGDAIKQGVEAMGISTDFVTLNNGNSRINVKIKSNSETAINGQGPYIDKQSLDKLFLKLDNIKKDDYIVLAGSIPNSLPQNTYEMILKQLANRNIKTVVDATGDLLLNVLKYKPFLIKPNTDELSGLFDTEILSDDDIIKYAKKLQSLGALNVLVSRGEYGAILLDQNNKIHTIKAPKGKLVNSVGAGDSMVAGFIAGFIQNNDFDYALKLGTVCGSATAFEYGLANSEQINKLLNTMN